MQAEGQSDITVSLCLFTELR